jgi:hypothetical protein
MIFRRIWLWGGEQADWALFYGRMFDIVGGRGNGFAEAF